ncbi:MAG: choice-of-anchor J domain-containing protein [Chitinophagaceae bacterium]
MKKLVFLLFTIFSLVTTSYAQTPYTLSGTSYMQDFDGLANGLPQGWRVDTLVKPTGGLGNDASSKFSSTTSAWSNTGRGFKNLCSADGQVSTATSADQNASTDRALGVRQVSSAGWDDMDSLVSMSFYITNTATLNSFALTFKIQSLHTTAKRYNNWIVQYGIGTNPSSFTTVVTNPSVLTMDSNFTNTTVNVNFGSALDNQSQPVWIRICPQDTTMGSGSRPHVAIDDFNLTWSGTAVNNTPNVLTYTPANNAMNVPVSNSNLMIDFDKNITIGTGNVTINNITDATNQTIAASACTATGMNVTIPGVSLLAGKQYAVQYDSTCFMWTTYNCAGVYNNNTWVFTTEPPILPPATSLNENFFGCAPPTLGVFKEFSVVGSQTWRCSNFGHNDTDAVYMNGYSGGSLDNEDYLVSGPLDFAGMTNPYLHFWSKKRFTGTNTKEVMVSNNFAGDPTTSTWNLLSPNLSILDTTWKAFNNLNITAYKGSIMNIAFKYVSSSAGSSDEWSIDDVYVTDGPVGIYQLQNLDLQVYVLGQVTTQANISIIDQEANNYNVSIIDMFGKKLAAYQIQTTAGKNFYQIPTSALASGTYIVQIQNAKGTNQIKFSKN